jgi:hypothetical protein
MMRKEFIIVVAGAALSVAFVQAMASDTVGEIKRVDGAAMISKGEHFVAAQQGMKLQELDRLIVLEQSEALLEFQDGCSYVMKEKELLTVGSTSVCADNPAGVSEVEGTVAKTAPTDVAAAQRAATSQFQGGSPAFMTGAGLFAGVAGLGLIATFFPNNNGDPSTSPRAPFSPE